MAQNLVLTQDMQDFIDLLHIHQVAYLLVGGYAVNAYGYTRATQDIDFLIQPSEENAARIAQVLQDFGFGKAGLPAADFAYEGLAVHLGVEPNRIDLLTTISGLSTEEAFHDCAEIVLGTRNIKIIGLEMLIRSKRLSKRKKDLADAEELQSILAGQAQ